VLRQTTLGGVWELNVISTPSPSERAEACAEPRRGDERNVFCAYYRECLDHAVRAGWDDWTCERCALKDSKGAVPHARDFATSRPRSLIDQ
jgi:hypothetical protein